MFSSKRVGVLMDQAALGGGEAVLETLCSAGYEAIPISVDDEALDVVLRASGVQLVFNALPGRFGDDGCLQGLLELLGIPYTGSGVLASALSASKVKAKEIFLLHNLPTPAYYVLGQHDVAAVEEAHGSFGFPAVVKPAGGTHGAITATDLTELERAVAWAAQEDEQVLVERFVVGKQIRVAISNGRALGGVEILARTSTRRTRYRQPPRLSAERYRGVLTQALRAHEALGCAGVTLVDMIVSDLDNEYVIGVDTVPDLSPGALVPRIAQHAGTSYAELIEEILAEAAARFAVRVPSPFGQGLLGTEPRAIAAGIDPAA